MKSHEDARAALRSEGEIFRRERLRRRLSMAQTADTTRLRPRVIEAIEEGVAEYLPPPVFTTGLVQTYARYLGIDPQPYLESYRASMGVPAKVEIRPESAQIHYRTERVPGVLVGAVISILLIVLAGYLYQQYSAFVSGAGLAETTSAASVRIAPTPLPPTVTALPSASRSTPAPVTTPVSSGTPVPTATVALPTATPVVATPTPSPKGVKIDAVISGRVWTQVESDGRVVFSGILNSGDKRTWTAADHLMLWAGNAGLVTVTYNGKPLGRLGSPGEVMKVTWTATH